MQSRQLEDAQGARQRRVSSARLRSRLQAFEGADVGALLPVSVRLVDAVGHVQRSPRSRVRARNRALGEGRAPASVRGYSKDMGIGERSSRTPEHRQLFGGTALGSGSRARSTPGLHVMACVGETEAEREAGNRERDPRQVEAVEGLSTRTSTGSPSPANRGNRHRPHGHAETARGRARKRLLERTVPASVDPRTPGGSCRSPNVDGARRESVAPKWNRFAAICEQVPVACSPLVDPEQVGLRAARTGRRNRTHPRHRLRSPLGARVPARDAPRRPARQSAPAPGRSTAGKIGRLTIRERPRARPGPPAHGPAARRTVPTSRRRGTRGCVQRARERDGDVPPAAPPSRTAASARTSSTCARCCDSRSVRMLDRT